MASQQTTLVGRPAMPPYWSLGYHNCRWGYSDIDEVADVVANYSSAGIPLVRTTSSPSSPLAPPRPSSPSPLTRPIAAAGGGVDGH